MVSAAVVDSTHGADAGRGIRSTVSGIMGPRGSWH